MEKYCDIADDTDERLTTILSIDGGGMRGVIPGFILAVLEHELQKLDGENARIADYFDCVAGVSSGGITAALLTTPSEDGLPCAATEINKFYRREGPKIFSKEAENTNLVVKAKVKRYEPAPKGRFVQNLMKEPVSTVKKAGAWAGAWTRAWTSTKAFYSKYDNERLAQKIGEQVRGIRLADTLTNVVIPSYDLDDMRPVIFSTQEAKEVESDLQLADALMSTTATPFFFPPIKLPGEEHSLVDGGIAANNPTLFAIREAARMVGKDKCPDYSKFVVISLGTGSAKLAQKIGKGGIMNWLNPEKGVPFFVDVLFRASDDIVDISSAFAFGHSSSTDNINFLRIQDYTLNPNRRRVDDASRQNIDALETIAGDLLTKPVKVANPTTGLQDVPLDITNGQALENLAKVLSKERQRRISQAQRMSYA